jgi:aspartate aminotransferase/aminotransferase
MQKPKSQSAPASQPSDGGVSKLSARSDGIPEALSVYFNQLVYQLRRQGRDIVSLSLGEAYFSIPAFPFEKLDFDRGYHYSDSQGIPELRKRIADFYAAKYDGIVDPDKNVLISAGSKPIIFMVMLATLDPGDEVLIQEPAWVSYQEQARLVNAHVNFIPFDAPIAGFADYFTSRTKLVIINNPNNPAGRIYSYDELVELHALCRDNGVFLLVDEAYSDFAPPGTFHCLAKVVPDFDYAITVNSLSKNFGMSGWRVGYVIAHEEVIRGLLKINQHLITCAPTILLQYMARYFDDVLSHTLPQVAEVVLKRERVQGMCDRLGLRSLTGSATFYFFIDVDQFDGDIHDLALWLLVEKNISVVPGSAYGATTSRFIRVSIGTETEERIEEGLRTIATALSTRIDLGKLGTEMRRLGLGDYQTGIRR